VLAQAGTILQSLNPEFYIYISLTIEIKPDSGN
jgi:hypothetical protein